MKLIMSKNVQAGNHVAKDIHNKEGAILIPKGFKVNNPILVSNILNSNEILRIYVERDETSENIKEEILSQEVMNKSNLNIEEVTLNIHRNKKEIEEEISEIMKNPERNTEKLNLVIEDTINLFKENSSTFTALQELKYMDSSICTHLQNVSIVSYMIGVWMGLKSEELDKLLVAGLFADVGKENICKEILGKTDKLTDDEYKEIEKHTLHSVDFLRKVNILDEDIINAVLLHHERLDGSGYPYGYTKEKISTIARVIAIADVFTALTSDRPHRGKITPFEAINVLRTQFIHTLDMGIILTFSERLLNNYIGAKVKMSNGKSGEIMFINNITKQPLIAIDNDIIDMSTTSLKIVEFL